MEIAVGGAGQLSSYDRASVSVGGSVQVPTGSDLAGVGSSNCHYPALRKSSMADKSTPTLWSSVPFVFSLRRW